MKTAQLLSLLIFCFNISIQTTKAQSGCGGYYSMDKGTSYELTSYDKKNKPTTISRTKIIEATAVSGGQKATCNTIVTDPKGEEIANADYSIKCSKNEVSMDFSTLMGKTMAARFGSNAKADITGTDLIIPNNLSTGQTLPDSTMNMKVEIGAMNMNFDINTFNRKVEGNEKLTTPAGTFDCVVISSETKIKTIMSNSFKSKTWYAKGVGMVQQENYSNKGTIESKEILTAFKK